ncbi:DUF1223 domain-containing protein [Palleronia sediminis]|uniref:DUF1223 domain-containing protein n=2 Tax=Palleronia sediminis TaxID=2547833 RepID=A0A4R6A9M3_9RHOB|nr:DUF1223 domain-containing protein [Palleronia sediminis]
MAEERTQPVVLELFTSQGCSSCPPADAMLAHMAGRDDVLPLAFHVDYWDYLGWADSFSDPAFTHRQKGYARKWGERMVYTPQAVIGGVDSTIGSRSLEVADFLMAHWSVPERIDIDTHRRGETVEITLSPHDAAAGPLPRDIAVHLARYDPIERVSIPQGENAGLEIDYANIVTDWEHLAEWDGTAPMTLSVRPGDHAALIVQQGGQGPILGAQRIGLAE